MIQSAQDLLKTTLAASLAFRSWVGAANADQALAKIYHDYWPDPAADVYTLAEVQGYWPSALIYTVPERGWSYERDAAGTNNWAARGELVCILQRSFPVNDDGFEDAEKNTFDVEFREAAGDIIADLVDMSETAGYLASTGFSVSGPFRTPPEDRDEAGDMASMEIVIRWGNR